MKVKQAGRIALIGRVASLIFGYVLFFAAGLRLVVVVGIEVGVPISSAIIAAGLYIKMKESVVSRWDMRMDAPQTITSLNNLKSWLKANMPVKFQQQSQSKMSYLYRNDQTFFLMTIIATGENTTIEFQSDNNLRGVFWSLQTDQKPTAIDSKADESQDQAKMVARIQANLSLDLPSSLINESDFGCQQKCGDESKLNFPSAKSMTRQSEK